MPIEETEVIPFITVLKHVECQESETDPCEFVYDATFSVGILEFSTPIVCGYPSAHEFPCSTNPEHSHRICCYHKEFIDAEKGAEVN